MKFCRWLSLLLLTLVPMSARAITLQWASGSTMMSFSEPTRCVLVVRADSTEGMLPAEWRLLWLADSSGVKFVAEGPGIACAADTARVSTVTPPTTAADSAAHMLTTEFCSAGSAVASVAYFVLDQPGGSCARFKVVALDPNDPDSTDVIESNEVTTNGGVEGEFALAAMAASTTHDGIQYVVHASGSALSRVSQVMAQAPDSLWSVPLQITEQNDSSLTAVANIAASMPASVLRLTSTDGAVSVASLAADGVRESVDPDFEALADSCRFHHCYYFDPDPNVYPKDFAFIYAVSGTPLRGLFHIFYTRNHKNAPTASTQRSFGHAWSSDLRNWQADTSAAVFSVSTNDWDRAHVWAPSIVQVGPKYQMFYTGVDNQTPTPNLYGNQRIGYATADSIETGSATVWTRRSSPTYTVNRTGWADRDSATTGTHRHQFRDPLIIADPDSAGRYLLFMVGQKQDGDYAVGVARNEPGTLDAWRDLGYYRNTEYEYSGNGRTVESVCVFPDAGYPESKSSAQATWRLLFTHGINSPDDQTIRFTTKKLGAALADTTLGPTGDRVWSTPATNLFTYLNGDTTGWGTYATEYLRAGRVDFLATFDGTGILVSRMAWNGTDFTLLQPSVAAVEDRRQERGSPAALRVIEAAPGSGRLTFQLDLPTRQRVRLGIYDVAGRRVRSLIEGELPVGMTRVQWNGKDDGANAVRAGVYFAKLSSSEVTSCARLSYAE